MQFTLQTLLLVFVVLASSLGMFGNGGIFVFIFVLLAAAIIHWWTSCLAKLLALIVSTGFLIALLLPPVSSSREAALRAYSAAHHDGTREPKRKPATLRSQVRAPLGVKISQPTPGRSRGPNS
jgi:hypothetical protein